MHFKISLFIYSFFGVWGVCACMPLCIPVPWCTGGGQRTTCRDLFSPSTMWAPGTELRSSGWRQAPCFLSISLARVFNVFLRHRGWSVTIPQSSLWNQADMSSILCCLVNYEPVLASPTCFPKYSFFDTYSKWYNRCNALLKTPGLWLASHN